MQLTSETLAAFVGGQLEVQNQGEGYLYRGEIRTTKVENNEVQVTLAWMAKGEGYSPIPNRWVADERLDYGASLEIYSVSNIGPSPDGGADRICLMSSIVGEVVVFYPPDGSRLDPARVDRLFHLKRNGRFCLGSQA